MHLRRFHGVREGYECNRRNRSIGKFYRKRFLSAEALLEHWRIVHGQDSPTEVCELCGKLLASRTSLAKYKKRVHRADEDREAESAQ